PVAASVFVLLGLGVANREYLIPRCAPFLLRETEDPLGRRPLLVQGCYDGNQVHIEGRVAFPDRKMIQHARITLPPEFAGGLVHLTCKEMFFREANERDAAGWWLMACKPEKLDRSHPLLHWLGPGTYFLFTDLNYERLTRRPNWFFYQSTGR